MTDLISLPRKFFFTLEFQLHSNVSIVPLAVVRSKWITTDSGSSADALTLIKKKGWFSRRGI